MLESDLGGRWLGRLKYFFFWLLFVLGYFIRYYFKLQNIFEPLTPIPDFFGLWLYIVARFTIEYFGEFVFL